MGFGGGDIAFRVHMAILCTQAYIPSVCKVLSEVVCMHALHTGDVT